MNLRNRKVIIIIIVSIVVVVGLILFANRGSSTDKINDAGGPPVSGLVDPDNQLLNVTTSSDFVNIQNRISDYLVFQNAKISLKVVISDVQTPDQSSSILKFNISIPDLNQKDVGVEVDYAGNPEPTFSIPSKQFTTPITGEEN